MQVTSGDHYKEAFYFEEAVSLEDAFDVFKINRNAFELEKNPGWFIVEESDTEDVNWFRYARVDAPGVDFKISLVEVDA